MAVGGEICTAAPRLRLERDGTADAWRLCRARVLADARARNGEVCRLDGRSQQLGATIFLEIGPTADLVESWQAARCLPMPPSGCRRSARDGTTGGKCSTALVACTRRAGDIDWRGFDRDYQRRPLAMPTYPFERRRFWIDTTATSPQHSVERRIGPPHTSAARPPARLGVEGPSIRGGDRVDHHAVPRRPCEEGHGHHAGHGAARDGAGDRADRGRWSRAVHDLVIVEPLTLHDESPQIVQSIVTPEGTRSAVLAVQPHGGRAERIELAAACHRHAQASARRTRGRFDRGHSQGLRSAGQCDRVLQLDGA